MVDQITLIAAASFRKVPGGGDAANDITGNRNANVAAELDRVFIELLAQFWQTHRQRANRRREMKMKKTLMTTAAAAAVIGFTAIASAQTTQGPAGGGASKPEGDQIGQKSGAGAGGAMMHQQNGAQPAAKQMSPSAGKSAAPSSGKAAQDGQPGAKPNEKMGQSQKNDATPQHGAQEEPGKSGASTDQQHANQDNSGSRAVSVQFSQDQRSRIGAVIGKSSSARVTTNVNFNVSVGARVPSDVHVAVVPEDVVEIVPQYEGFDYVVVGEQILIIDPNDMEIVAIIEA
jgi:hypothetical protein